MSGRKQLLTPLLNLTKTNCTFAHYLKIAKVKGNRKFSNEFFYGIEIN